MTPNSELDSLLTNVLNRSLHIISLQLADLYGELYAVCNTPIATDGQKNALGEVLIAYRTLRRCITVNPATNKRYGASQADAMIKGEID
jgi:hypothetical protein